MLIPPETLIDGCVRTLIDAVLPSVDSRVARGQVYAVVDVLRNLRDRVEERAAHLTAEAESAHASLLRAAEALTACAETPAREAGARLAALLAAAPAAPLAARLDALRAGVASALEALETLGEPAATGARAALGGHFAAQSIRDVSTLKPSLLAEISKG